MNIFVNKDDIVMISVYIWMADDEVNATNNLEEAKDKYETLEFVFKRPAYEDSLAILSAATRDGGVDPVALNDAAFRRLWIKTIQGDTVIETSSQNINTMLPAIVRAATSGLLNKCSI
jgi:hypothetical protein